MHFLTLPSLYRMFKSKELRLKSKLLIQGPFLKLQWKLNN